MTDLLVSLQRGLSGARAQLLASSVLFGLMAALTRQASLRGFTSGQLATVRFAVGVAATVLYFGLRPGALQLERKGLLAVRGILGGAAVLLYFAALSRIPAGEATLLNNLYPVFMTILAVFILGERPTVRLGLALVLTTAGVVLVLGGGELRPQLGWGELAGFGSAVLGAGAVLSIRALRLPTASSLPVNAATVFFAFSFFGLAVSWPFALEPWPALGGPGWGLALGAAVTSLVAQVLMTNALGFLSIPESAIWQQLTPIISYAWAALIADEAITLAAVVGAVVAAAGVVYGDIGDKRAPEPSSVPEPGAEQLIADPDPAERR